MEKGFKFDANDQTLSDVFFETKRKYRVPRYQRPYAWVIDNVSDFWDDILQNDQPYFLGSFIFNTEHEKKDKYLDIIDGQQRLLTITILMAVLRDVTQAIDNDSSELIQRQDIAIEDWEGKSSLRIKPSESLEPFFKKYIQIGDGKIIESKPVSLEEKRVKANYEFLLEKVSIEIERVPTKTEKLLVVQNLRKSIRELMVINIEIAEEEDAYDIFETTNARGMELSVGDLLKNLIFKNVPPGDDRDFAKDVWKEVTKNIEETNMELKRFIRYFWLSKFDFVQEKKLYKEIKRNIADSEMQDFLQQLWDNSALFNILLEGDESDFDRFGDNFKKIFQSVFALRLMGVTQCFVLLLSILRNFNKLGFDPYKTFQLIEKFTFLYSVICKLPGNKVEKIYSKYAIEIDKFAKNGPSEKVLQKLNSIFAQLRNELTNATPSEGLFEENFSEVSYKNSTESRMQIKYILEKINSYYKKTDEYRINFDAVNIEHLLPQAPNKDWNLSKTQIKEYVDKLGNLTLLSTKLNSEVQNSTIPNKLPILKQSQLEITKEVVKLLEELDCQWGKNEIISRHQNLAKIAYREIWKL